ncbi:MAG: TadE/TadG family type IV pilus assembly protein [Rhodoblastus sp.]
MIVRRLLSFFGRRAQAARSRGAEFAGDARGATAVEFGIVSIPFFMILCAIFEAAFLLFNQSNLENATYDASRQLLTGQIQSNGQTTSQQLTTFTNLVCGKLWKSFNCNNVKIDVRSASDYTNAFDTTKTVCNSGQTASYTTGSSGNVLVVRVCYPYPLYFNRFSGFNSSTVTLMATTVFKSENY